jgi:hypothetical protein
MNDEMSLYAQELFAQACAAGAMPEHHSPFFDVSEIHDRWMAERAWQATLQPSDPRHEAMSKIVTIEAKDWVLIYWGGYEYSYELSRIERPEDLLWLIDHLAEKEWEHATFWRVARLIRKIAHRKGWKPYERIPHRNECPPAFMDAQAEREKLTPAMRYSVIKRDGSRCRCCGASVSTGAILHVDHIIPVSKGGLTKLGNLQTLCAVCNQGKAAR